MTTPTEKVSVTLYLRPEQVEKLKALLRDHRDDPDGPTWKTWKGYARTFAALAFDERLERRYENLTREIE